MISSKKPSPIADDHPNARPTSKTGNVVPYKNWGGGGGGSNKNGAQKSTHPKSGRSKRKVQFHEKSAVTLKKTVRDPNRDKIQKKGKLT